VKKRELPRIGGGMRREGRVAFEKKEKGGLKKESPRKQFLEIPAGRLRDRGKGYSNVRGRGGGGGGGAGNERRKTRKCQPMMVPTGDRQERNPTQNEGVSEGENSRKDHRQ